MKRICNIIKEVYYVKKWEVNKEWIVFNNDLVV